MNAILNRIIKNIVFALAVLNIAVMMLFEYGLPSPAAMAIEDNFNNQDGKDTETGTIESVQEETAAKEAEAVKNALAREETDSQNNEIEEEETEIKRDPNAPILELTDDHIYLHVGDRFNYMSYIKTMEDVDGSDLSHYIHLDGYVNTYVPGDYPITYRITSPISGETASKELLVTVE